MKKIVCVFVALVVFVGCNETPNAAKYLNKAGDIMEACGDKEEALKHLTSGLMLIESKEKSQIPLTSDEVESVGRLFVLAVSDKCEEVSK